MRSLIENLFIFVYNFLHVDAGWSSLVARRAHHPRSLVQIRAPATKFLNAVVR